MHCITCLFLSALLPVSLAYSQQTTPTNVKNVPAPSAIPPPPDGSGIVAAPSAILPSPIPSGYQLVIPAPEVLGCETIGTCTPDVAKRGLWLYRFTYTDAIMNHGESPEEAAKKAEDARELCEGLLAMNIELAPGESEPDANPVKPGSGIENSRAAYVYGQTLTREACTPGANGDTVEKDAALSEASYRLANREAWAKLQPQQPGSPKLSIADAPAKPPSASEVQAPSACEKNVSFARIIDGKVVPEYQNFESKWLERNGKKFPGLCFSATPDPQAANYLIVFSTSQSAFNGLQPSFHTTTSTNMTPVSGNGTITDTYGGTWNYTYNGTDTSTTTTTTQSNLPYTVTTNSLYENTYTQSGILVSQRSRSVSTQTGGDPGASLGANLVGIISGVHIKERLLKDAVKDVEMQPK